MKSRECELGWVLGSVVVLAFVSAAVLGAAEAAELTVQVTGNGKAVENAEVFVRDSRHEFRESVKTDREGRAVLKGVPIGEVVVQVTAKGWRTKGRREALESGENLMEFELKRRKPRKSDVSYRVEFFVSNLREVF